jgi:hypothetical protein
MCVISYAGPPINPANIQENIKVHLEKVKLTNPQKYQEMMKKTGGTPTQCTDCHQEVLKGNLPGQEVMEGINPLRK